MIRFMLMLLLLSQLSFAQNTVPGSKIKRPKLVVGIVVDQMRWDFLYRYYDRYATNGGFKRLLNKGFSCENNHINYIPTYTACGHTAIYTGTVPAIHGITGNEWWDVMLKREVYCVEDDSAKGVGTTEKAGQMSPRNLLSTTISDELKISTNFRSKVIGVSFKDRGAILPAGHAADAAYWYEPASGKFITSSYYMKSLPPWVTAFNDRKLPTAFLKKGWATMYPIQTYKQSDTDVQDYESKPLGLEQQGFPYKLEQFIDSNFGALTYTPFGNTVTKEMAMSAVTAEQLGADSITDFLAVSFSTPDYIGHAFGPNSVEAEDNYLRLDKDLGELLDFLDTKVGKGEYLLFISADHGVSNVPAYLNKHRIPGKSMSDAAYQTKVDSILRIKFGNHRFVESEQNSQLFFNHQLLDSLKINRQELFDLAINYLKQQEGITRVFVNEDASNITMPEKLKSVVANGYYPKRSGDIQYLMLPGYFAGGSRGTTHGSPYTYDTHIPLVWYGWHVKPGRTVRETHTTDVASTIAMMLRLQLPSGNIGAPITEVTD